MFAVVVAAAGLRIHDFVMKANYNERWMALAKLIAMPTKKVAFNAQVRITWWELRFVLNKSVWNSSACACLPPLNSLWVLPLSP